MKVGYIILCRFNSSRLPGKILKEINGKSLIQIILERLSLLGKDNIIVATSVEKTDDIIAAYCEKNNINVYRGSLNNVAGRFLSCAEQFGLDYAVRINGDNLFADPTLITSITRIALDKQLDFVSNVPGRTFPTGMSVEVVNVDFYKKMYSCFNEEKYFEHVTLFLYEHPEYTDEVCEYVKNTEIPLAAGSKMAIDTEEDFQTAVRIIRQLGDDYTVASWQRIINLKDN